MSHAKMRDVPKMDNYDGQMLETGLIRDHLCAFPAGRGNPAEGREKLSLARTRGGTDVTLRLGEFGGKA